MAVQLKGPLRLNLAQRFLLSTLVIMVAGMLGISAWLGKQIEAGVVRQSGATAALLLDGLVGPQLQDLAKNGQLDGVHIQALKTLQADTTLNKWVVAFSVRDLNGRLLYASDSPLAGLQPPTAAELAAAGRGEVTSEIDKPEKDADSALRKYSDRLVKTYSPVREDKSGRIFALIEFYQDLDTLQTEIAAAQRRSWLVVGSFMLGMFVLLTIFSRRSSDTIDRQQQELRRQVARLTDLLEQNRTLHDRVQRAAAEVAGLHESLLRRVGSELHDGPAQDLGLALMQMDLAVAQSETAGLPSLTQLMMGIQSALQNALTEMRGIAAGLALPQLAGMSTGDALAHAVRAHERRTHTAVELQLGELPADLPLPVKITAYRLVQEALNNAFKHAGGAGQRVCAQGTGSQLSIEVSDGGPGFDAATSLDTGEHLGLAGMRERVESLGGTFEVHSSPGKGTTITAILQLPGSGEIHG